MKEYLTLDEALKNNLLTIKELYHASVNTVQMKNKGKVPIFVMTSEVIKGAKQDRMVKHDILIPPNGEWVKVPVCCVEQGRWKHVSSEFTSAGKIVPSAIRKASTMSDTMSESQDKVWNSISSMQSNWRRPSVLVPAST